jgi:hypothetical protein
MENCVWRMFCEFCERGLYCSDFKQELNGKIKGTEKFLKTI